MPYSAVDRLRIRELVAQLEDQPSYETRLLTLIDTFLTLEDRRVAIRRGVLLALAVHSHHEQRKEWPATLDEPTINDKALQIDPFTSRPFIYRLTDKGPLLYSTGPDGRDDGGATDAAWAGTVDAGDFVFLPATLPYKFKNSPNRD